MLLSYVHDWESATHFVEKGGLGEDFHIKILTYFLKVINEKYELPTSSGRKSKVEKMGSKCEKCFVFFEYLH